MVLRSHCSHIAVVLHSGRLDLNRRRTPRATRHPGWHDRGPLLHAVLCLSLGRPFRHSPRIPGDRVCTLDPTSVAARVSPSSMIKPVPASIRARVGNKLGTVLATSAPRGHNAKRPRWRRASLGFADFKHHRNLFPMRRRWQTHRTQNPVPARGCGFKSHLRYYRLVTTRILVLAGKSAVLGLTRGSTKHGPGGGWAVAPSPRGKRGVGVRLSGLQQLRDRSLALGRKLPLRDPGHDPMTESSPGPGGRCGLKRDQQKRASVDHERLSVRPGVVCSRALAWCFPLDGRLSSGQFEGSIRPMMVGMSRRQGSVCWFRVYSSLVLGRPVC